MSSCTDIHPNATPQCDGMPRTRRCILYNTTIQWTKRLNAENCFFFQEQMTSRDRRKALKTFNTPMLWSVPLGRERPTRLNFNCDLKPAHIVYVDVGLTSLQWHNVRKKVLLEIIKLTYRENIVLRNQFLVMCGCNIRCQFCGALTKVVLAYGAVKIYK